MHLGNNEYGHSEFGSTKSIIVELVYQLKYNNQIDKT